MRYFTLVAFVAFIVVVCAMPITPAAPTLQRRAEHYRLQGLKEHEIAARLGFPEEDPVEEPEPIPATLTERLTSLFHRCMEEDEDHDDRSGDIAPGSLSAPEMLPHAAHVDDTVFSRLISALGMTDPRKDYAYEGKELELRRPTGMRHWGAQDKWRLF